MAFHEYLFSLMCTSLIISVASTSFAALAITFSPAVWLIPIVVVMTFSYHTLVLLVARSETYTTPRIYSMSSVTCAYLLTSLWAAGFVTSVTFTYLVLTKKWTTTNNEIHIWMILLSVLSLIEIIIMGFIAISSHKELRRLRYRQKWEWRNGGPAGTAQWRSVALLYSRYLEN
jgi:hypothetical protein